jgi:hypothetical protein
MNWTEYDPTAYDRDDTTTNRLARRGYDHRAPTDEDRAWSREKGSGAAASTGRRTIVDRRTGERIGLMNCFEANDWIAAGCPRADLHDDEDTELDRRIDAEMMRRKARLEEW